MGRAFPEGTAAELAQVAQFYQSTYLDRPALYEYLHRRFEEEQQDNAPGQVAEMLATMPNSGKPLFLITTNYDSFVERAFQAAKRDLCVITQNMRDPELGATALTLRLPDGSTQQEESIEFEWKDEDRFPADCAFLFKMHGSVHRSVPSGGDDVIITEDDYVDFMVNSGGRASPYFPPPALRKAYKRRRFLFLGYSLHDWNFRAFLRTLAVRNALSPDDVRRHLAVQKNPKPIEVALWLHRNVNVYDGDLADFCNRMGAVWTR